MQTTKKKWRSWMVIVVFGLLLAGCGKKAEREFVPPTRRPPPPTVLPVAAPEVMIKNALDGEFAATTERTHVTLSKSGNLVEADIDYVAPDRYYYNIEGIELILIGKQGYAKVDGKWRTEPKLIDKARDDLVDIIRNSLKVEEAEFLEQVTYRSEPTHVYHYRLSWTDQQGDKVSDGKMWIRVADGMPMKAEEDLFLGELRYRMNYQFEYDLDIKIEPPI